MCYAYIHSRLYLLSSIIGQNLLHKLSSITRDWSDSRTFPATTEIEHIFWDAATNKVYATNFVNRVIRSTGLSNGKYGL